jgi:hypothetical protein
MMLFLATYLEKSALLDPLREAEPPSCGQTRLRGCVRGVTYPGEQCVVARHSEPVDKSA